MKFKKKPKYELHNIIIVSVSGYIMVIVTLNSNITFRHRRFYPGYIHSDRHLINQATARHSKLVITRRAMRDN